MPYTVHDAPELVARIEGDLATVVHAVRVADPGLRSLVLTGGFARGEGAVLDGVPQNDYDFVAIRGVGRKRVPYPRLRADLERRLGIHVDLAPVSFWRLRWVRRSIFWYETAKSGRVLWGTDLFSRIPVRTASDLDRGEGLRLLANRAAGLLLATESPSAHERRLQAAKALLAALDANLLALGNFAPSQTERWAQYEAMREEGAAPDNLEHIAADLAWAFTFKVDPGRAAERHPDQVWRLAARAVLDAVPVALRHARLESLESYARRDGIVDRLVYWRRARDVPGARRLARHPTGRVRVATLRLLEASLDGRVRPEVARECLSRVAAVRGHDPLRLLAALRHATLQ